jgi:DNA-binding MarR family transcriptional regulator
LQDRFEIFTKLISKISRNIRRIKTEEVAEFDLKSPHVSCLYYLYKKRGLCVTELADICDEDKAAVSRSIDYLEYNGYIECQNDGTRRYKAPLLLTEKGNEVGAKIAEKIDRVLLLTSEGLDDNERKIFYKALNVVSENLERITKK